MHYRYFQAVASCAAAIAFATTTSSTTLNAAPQWTSLNVGSIIALPPGYGLTLARLPDGRFVLGDQGSLYIQNTWGAAAKTQISNNSVTFDPSFVAVANGTSALLGGGGFAGASGLFGFNPSSSATPLMSTALTTSLQNYSGVYWQHPTSGNKGWIIGGVNAAGKHNLTYVSVDGTKVGAITAALSTYSSAICTDASANVYASLSEYMTADVPDSEKVLKFTADQIDAAVAAVITGTPAPIARDVTTSVYQFDSAASIAVDAQGRLWAAGYNGYMQAYDPANGFARTFTPDNPPIAHASGPTAYQVQAFQHAGIDYVGFLASDSYTALGSSIFEGYKPVSQLITRAVWFDQSQAVVGEAAGTKKLTVNISPAPTATVTVPLTVSGTAVKGRNYSVPASVIFHAGDHSQDITLTIINNAVDDAADKTVVVKLGAPVPATQAYAPPAGATCTLTITDDDHKPVIATTQNFGAAQVGSAYTYQVALTNGTAAPKFTASGLPPGMTINRDTGVISGRPTVPGEYDQVWITATSTAGTAVTAGYVITVGDFAPAAHGGFVGYVDRGWVAADGLGARIDINVTPVATFTGKVTIGSVAYPLSGLLDTSTANPSGSASFKRGLTAYTVSFGIDGTTGALSGIGGNIHGWRAQTASTLTGLHNFFAATPGGPGAGDPHGTTYGTVSVLATGMASTSIHAADGAVFATSAPMGPLGEVLVYQTAYAVPGSLLGSLTIASDTPQKVGGALTWSRPVAAGGWASNISLAASGGKYHPVSGVGIVMDLSAASGNNATLAFQDGGLTATSTSFHMAAPAVAPLATPSKLTITNSTGAFSGSYPFTIAGKSIQVSFQGLIVPDTTTADAFDGTGEGYFLTPGTGSVVTRSGMVSLSAAP